MTNGFRRITCGLVLAAMLQKVLEPIARTSDYLTDLQEKLGLKTLTWSPMDTFLLDAKKADFKSSQDRSRGIIFAVCILEVHPERENELRKEIKKAEKLRSEKSKKQNHNSSSSWENLCGKLLQEWMCIPGVQEQLEYEEKRQRNRDSKLSSQDPNAWRIYIDIVDRSQRMADEFYSDLDLYQNLLRNPLNSLSDLDQEAEIHLIMKLEGYMFRLSYFWEMVYQSSDFFSYNQNFAWQEFRCSFYQASPVLRRIHFQ